VIPGTAPSDAATEDLVRQLRKHSIPAAIRGQGIRAEVGGITAGYVDLADEISARLIVAIMVVTALSCLLLLLAFRSVVIPLTAALMNLVSIGTASFRMSRFRGMWRWSSERARPLLLVPWRKRRVAVRRELYPNVVDGPGDVGGVPSGCSRPKPVEGTGRKARHGRCSQAPRRGGGR
jgi:MMPL family